ncbi:hypothetical protein Y032_0032g2578 [Ancylostoma ceylanicum]|uniref:Uncharacterized protein n=1 Tax=Ancylostoma ceylanicum TaxID=53326 RepID=A0A016UR15_9BILA|nr:hypothetical protein Y032_0032g2578 [Ancylostoma ceylanicum]
MILQSQEEKFCFLAERYSLMMSTATASKYIAGHTDVIAGCVTTKSMKHWERLKLQQFTTGSALSPFDAALVARGLKTLPLRVDKICSNAQAVAQFLAKHPKVHRVSYPGLESHPTHEAGKKYMKNWSGMIGFDVGTAANAIKVAETVRLIVHAVSLGGTESLMEHPLSMSHGSELLREETEPMVPPGLLRLSIGVENAEDLIEDLERALSLI